MRRLRAMRAWLIYRFDKVLDWPPIAQVLAIFALTALIVSAFAGLDALAGHTSVAGHENVDDDPFFWALTHFLDGGTVAQDEGTRRGIGLLATIAGITTLALLTAALTSQMAARIVVMRSGLSAVVEKGHVLCLGFGPDVPLVARELARSRQRVTLVVLTQVDKDRVDASLRAARSVAGSRLRTVVRTGDPRTELALLQIAAPRARSAIVIPPNELDDEGSVRWTLATLLALRRVVGPEWTGHVVVETRHAEATELLELAAEPDVAGPGALRTDIIAADAVLGGILAQSVRDDGIYFVLRHLLAFDGAEIYGTPMPAALVGKTFDYAFAKVDGAVALGICTDDDRLDLCPAGDRVLAASDVLLAVAASRGQLRLDGRLPEAPPLVHAPKPEPLAVTIVGVNGTVPHLVRDLMEMLPATSSLHLVAGDQHTQVRAMLASMPQRSGRLTVEVDDRPGTALARDASPRVCGADAVVILGPDAHQDENVDASALAMLLRLRHATKRTNGPHVRVVTEVRDPRSAAHIAPSKRDCVVSSDVVAMLVAQCVIDPETAPAYREILGPSGAWVALRSRHDVFGDRQLTFAEASAGLRRAGEIAIGIFPDPRREPDDREAVRRELEEGAAIVGEDAWLNPPRTQPIPTRAGTAIVVLTRSR